MERSLIQLMNWLSPVFPTGGFAYSSGLEQAVADGIVTDADSLEHWIVTQLQYGSPWNDQVLFAAAWRACQQPEELDSLSSLTLALAGSAQRYRETVDQGRAFLQAARHWFDGDTGLGADAPLPVAVATACGRMAIPLNQSLAAYLGGWVSNQAQVGIRLAVMGQDSAAALLARTENAVVETAYRAGKSTLGDLGSIAVIAEIANMRHETLQPRLFLS